MSADKRTAAVVASNRAIVTHLLRQAFMEANSYLAQALFAEARAWLDRDAANDDDRLGFEVEARKVGS